MKKTLNPAPAPHADAARLLLEKIRALQAEVPRLTPFAPQATRRLVATARLSDVGIEAATVAIERSSRLAIAANADPASVRDAYSYALAYSQVVKELHALARTVAHTVRAERAFAGAAALDIYAMAERMSKQVDGAEFLPFVEDIRKMLKNKKGRKTNSSPDSAPLVPSAPSQSV
jgi:hypothetical protein